MLHVTQPTSGGVAGYVADACADQLARGWRVAVAAPVGTWLAEPHIRYLHWPATREPGRHLIAEVRRLRHLVEEFRPDVVHLHSAKAGLAGRLAMRGRVPTVFQPHGWSWLAAGPVTAPAVLAWERAGARWATVVVCVGQGEANLARAHGVRAPLAVVRNGVDAAIFHWADDYARNAARAALGIGPATPLVVCVGRVTRQKGQDRLLAAWPTVLARRADAQLVIVGGGDQLSGPPGVRFTGHVADVRPWYAAADVVVQPSRWEGLPLTVLEAMASGRPVVASDIAGHAEVVSPATGALVDADDPASLAGEIVRRLNDSALARAEGTAAAATARRDFPLRTTLDRLADVTERAAARVSTVVRSGRHLVV